jgi:carboxymethylenebutenolidase
MDQMSLAPPNAAEGRRRLLATKLAAGFAMAVRPVSAGTITTGSEGLAAGEVRIPTSDGGIPAYRAMPAKGSKFLVELVVQFRRRRARGTLRSWG